MVEKRKNKPSPWKNSQAKVLLQQDILASQVHDSMKPKEVFEKCPEYEPYSIKNFWQNLYSLHASIKQNQARANSNSATLAHDCCIQPPSASTSKGYPRWDGSDAEWFLKEDVNAGLADSLKPSMLHKSQLEYQAFPLAVFWDHIYQEKCSHTEKAYWLNHKQKAN